MENKDFREEILTGIKNGTDLWEVANKYKNMGMDKRSMIETIVSCYSATHEFNQVEKQELLRKFYDN